MNAEQMLLAPLPLRRAAFYPRLSTPVPMDEPSLIDVLPDRAAEFASYASYVENNNQSGRKKKADVYLFDLLPMTQVIQLEADIPERIWEKESVSENDSECSWHEVFKRYRGMKTEGRYHEMILGENYEKEIDPYWGDIGIFGKCKNSLTTLVQLAGVVNSNERKGQGKGKDKGHNLLMHGVAIICLQFYLMERNRFFEVYAKETEEWTDSLQPYLISFFQRYDVKKDTYPIPVKKLQSDCIAETARTYDYLSFLVSILKLIAPRCNDILGPKNHLRLTPESISGWCSSKLFNNTNQFFITSGFMHMRIDNFPARLMDSLVQKFNRATFTGAKSSLVSDSNCKYFTAPDNYNVTTLRFTGKPPYNNRNNKPDVVSAGVKTHMRSQAFIPVLYCHYQFSPYEAAFTLPLRPKAGAPDLAEEKWQDYSLRRLASYIDRTLFKEAITCLNTAYKADQKVTNEAKIRPVHREYMPMNEVRLRYSFIILMKMQIAHECASFMHRSPTQQVYSQSAPLFISRPCWQYWMRKTYDKQVYDPIRLRGPLVTECHNLDEAELRRDYHQVKWPYHFRPTTAKWYYLKSLQVCENTAEFEAICAYICFRARGHKTIEKHNWYVLYYALIVLLQNEEAAAIQLANDRQDKSLHLLHSLQQDYLKEVESLRQYYEMYFKNDQKIAELFNECQRKWKSSHMYSDARPSQEEWQAAITSAQYHKWLQNVDGFLECEWECVDESDQIIPLTPLVLALCQSWVEQKSKPFVPPSRYFNCTLITNKDRKNQFRLSSTTIDVHEFAEAAYRSLHVHLSCLGLCWRFLLPAAVIPAPADSPMKELHTLKLDLPLVYATLRKTVKIARSAKFQDELRSYQINATTPLITRSAFNSIHYLYKVVKESYNAGGKDETLDLLADLSRDRETGVTVSVDIPKDKAIKRAINQVNANLRLFGRARLELEVERITHDLAGEFDAMEIPARIVEILNGVSTENKVHVQKFFAECEKEKERIVNCSTRTPAQNMMWVLHKEYTSASNEKRQLLDRMKKRTTAQVEEQKQKQITRTATPTAPTTTTRATIQQTISFQASAVTPTSLTPSFEPVPITSSKRKLEAQQMKRIGHIKRVRADAGQSELTPTQLVELAAGDQIALRKMKKKEVKRKEKRQIEQQKKEEQDCIVKYRKKMNGIHAAHAASQCSVEAAVDDDDHAQIEWE